MIPGFGVIRASLLLRAFPNGGRRSRPGHNTKLTCAAVILAEPQRLYSCRAIVSGHVPAPSNLLAFALGPISRHVVILDMTTQGYTDNSVSLIGKNNYA